MKHSACAAAAASLNFGLLMTPAPVINWTFVYSSLAIVCVSAVVKIARDGVHAKRTGIWVLDAGWGWRCIHTLAQQNVCQLIINRQRLAQKVIVRGAC